MLVGVSLLQTAFAAYRKLDYETVLVETVLGTFAFAGKMSPSIQVAPVVPFDLLLALHQLDTYRLPRSTVILQKLKQLKGGQA